MDIFKSTDIGILPLVNYVSLFLDKNNQDYNLVQLPPIQRNAVWKISQIEKLWDTILRGFPIGSFLVSKREKGVKTRTINSFEQLKSEKEGFFLLDGQQRTRAILLGFTHSENARLWIDLNPKLTFGNAELNDRQFLIRVTSTYQPWGMKQSNPDEKLNEHQKYTERAKLFEKSVRYDYQVKINIPSNGDKTSYPIETNLPIPLDILINLCGGYLGNFKEPTWQEVSQYIPLQKDNEKQNEPPHFKKVILALKRLLDNSENNKEKRSVALLLQNSNFGIEEDEAEDENNRQQETIEVLFRRINSGGTVLAGEEMQYSILKANWDGAYEMVSNIVQDNKIGYLYSSTGLVMAAARLARFINSETDIPNPNVNNFRRWIGSKDNLFIEQMKFLLEVNKENKSIFKNVIELFCDITLYKEHIREDIGFPRKFLISQIDKKYFQPILTWIFQNRNEPNKIRNSRINILRYLVFASFGFRDANKVSKKAIEVLREKSFDVFPDTLIYKNCFVEGSDDLAIKIPNIEEFSKTLLAESRQGFLRYWHEVVGDETDTFREFRDIFWHKKELLLWFQRYYCSVWFQGYNPMSDDAFDTPYDYDHILPKSHLIISGGSNRINTNDEENECRFLDGRYTYINSIGNYRVWPSWANRSDGNKCQSEKLRLRVDDLSSDEIAQELQLTSKLDFLCASEMPIKDLELWNNASGNPRDWNENRRINWQSAVENRVIYLFSTFYNAFEFGKWKN